MTTEQKTELWGEELLEAFGDHINDEGWLTSDWAQILEDNFSNWDSDFNDTNEKKQLFGLMYNLDFEESADGNYVRPKEQEIIDTTPSRDFIPGELINHKKYGYGEVVEVLEDKISVLFIGGKPVKFLTYLFEKNLLPIKMSEIQECLSRNHVKIQNQ